MTYNNLTTWSSIYISIIQVHRVHTYAKIIKIWGQFLNSKNTGNLSRLKIKTRLFVDQELNRAQWVEILHRGPSQVKNRYYKKPLFVTIMNQNLWGNINLDIFVHCDVCRLKNGNFKNIKIVENHKKNFL